MEIQSISDIAAITALLNNEKLPADDIATNSSIHFFGAVDEQTLVGVIGCELYDDVALLRSLVVVDKYRSAGLASRLIETVEQAAFESGAQSVYLLTLNAHGYFQRHGYALIDREQAPAAIQQSAQFQSLCPGNAKLLLKTLPANQA